MLLRTAAHGQHSQGGALAASLPSIWRAQRPPPRRSTPCRRRSQEARLSPHSCGLEPKRWLPMPTDRAGRAFLRRRAGEHEAYQWISSHRSPGMGTLRRRNPTPTRRILKRKMPSVRPPLQRQHLLQRPHRERLRLHDAPRHRQCHQRWFVSYLAKSVCRMVLQLLRPSIIRVGFTRGGGQPTTKRSNGQNVCQMYVCTRSLKYRRPYVERA